MFAWARIIHGDRVLNPVRLHALVLLPYVPKWSLYSLPDALWLLSGLLFIQFIWSGKQSNGKIFWSILLWIIALGGEIGQAFGAVPGTFDLQDVYCMVIAGIVAHLTAAAGLRLS